MALLVTSSTGAIRMSLTGGSKSLRNNSTIITLADTLLVYTILAPIILNVIGSYVKLNENFFRTFFVLYGPGLISFVVYIRTYGVQLFKKNRAIICVVICLAAIVMFSALRNWESVHTKESLKFFLVFCVFGFLLGTAARITIQRAKVLNIIWLPYILIFFLFSLFLFRLWGYRGYNFTLPGDNPARIAALSLFFSFIGLTNLSLTKTVVANFFYGLIFFLCMFIAIFTNNRSVITVFGIILFCYLFFRFIQSKYKYEKLALMTFIGVLLLSCCLIWLGMKNNYFSNRILSILRLPEQTIAYVFNKDPVVYKEIRRLPMWHNAVDKFTENPLFGAGFGAEYYNEAIKEKYVHPHNILLQFLAETGLLGFGIFIVFVLAVIKRAIYNYRSLENNSDKLIYMLYPLSFTFFLLSSCFHFAIHENYFLWYFAGMIVGFETKSQPPI